MSTRLPLEIQDYIIDEIGASLGTNHPEEADKSIKDCLRNCLLVSRSISCRSRRHLYRCIDIQFTGGKTSCGLLLFTNLVEKSAEMGDLGLVKYIENFRLLIYQPYVSPMRDGTKHPTESTDLNDPVDAICRILRVLKEHAQSLQSFCVENTNPWPREGSIFGDWGFIPLRIRESISDLLLPDQSQDKLRRLKFLSLRNWQDVRFNLRKGTDITKLCLDSRPDCIGRDPASDNYFGKWFPCLEELETDIETLYLYGPRHRAKDSKTFRIQSSLKSLKLTINMPLLESTLTNIEKQRFIELGEVLKTLYPALKSLLLKLDCSLCDVGNELLKIPMDIACLSKLIDLQIEYRFLWNPSSEDISGPYLQNILTLLKYCPDTLLSLKWVIDQHISRAVGEQCEHELVEEYNELDRLLSEKFPQLDRFVICWQGALADPKSASLEQELPVTTTQQQLQKFKDAMPLVSDKLELLS